jgi:hypothetical protein
MSRVKELIVEYERKEQAAQQIGIEAGELETCEVCGVTFEVHSKDSLRTAYKIGNAHISNNDPLTQNFKNNAQGRRELTDILESLWTNFSDECRCKSQAREH